MYTSTCGKEYSKSMRLLRASISDFQKKISSITSLLLFKTKTYSQWARLTISMCKNLVFNWAIFPTTGANDTILPARDASFLAVTRGSSSCKCWILLLISLTRLWVTLSEPLRLFQDRPNQLTIWVGNHTDFSLFGTKPEAIRWLLKLTAAFSQSSLEDSLPQPSSKYNTTNNPLPLQCLRRGLKHFVKI